MTPSLSPTRLTADAAVVHAYAALTDDFNPIHVDPDFAARTPMGGCIVHGTVSLCLLWQSLFDTFGDAAPRRVALDVRFVKPVRVGQTLHAGGRQLADDPRCYAVWVRGDDGADHVTGTARLLAQGEDA